MKSPLEDTIWGASYGSVAAVRDAFDRIAPEYHAAVLECGVSAGAARALYPHLDAEARGIDFGCGSGALGLGLREEGLRLPLDGFDLSPRMLELAHDSGCYRRLRLANVLLHDDCPPPERLYDFAITMGLIGDYVPYYLALPLIVSFVRPGGFVGYAVETRSTPSYALDKFAAELRLQVHSETRLPVPEGTLAGQDYAFFVTQRR